MPSDVDRLTDKERETLRLLLAGHSAKSVAQELDLSVYTVNDRLREARKKLGVSSSKEAARLLAQHDQSERNSYADKGLGIALPKAGPHNPAQWTSPVKSNRLVAWTAGAALMISLIVAAAFLMGEPSDQLAPEPTPNTNFEQVSEQTALSWVALVDAGQWEESWKEASVYFRAAVSAEDWTAQVRPIREPLGKVKSRTLKDTQALSELPGAPKGDYRILSFATDFEAMTSAIETVVLAKTDEEWAVVGYFIRPAE